MMTISLSDAGKRYNRDWIFRHVNYTFESGNSYAITGPNGSGKSTLLQVTGSAVMTNEGSVQYSINNPPDGRAGVQCSIEKIYRHISICAPYLEVIEEMTAKEFLSFHQGFKPFITGVTIDSILSAVGLEKAMNKQIRYYSSGMKQRVKLAQCIFSDTSIILLDEPCTNLDAEGIDLYHSLISTYCKDRIVIVSSNDEVEYSFCKTKININDYKTITSR